MVTRLANADFGFPANSDLTPGVNEGGLRVWECTWDLMRYLAARKEILSGKRVLELGCGHGLAGICCKQWGAREVIFQDYNDSVLQRVTMANVAQNLNSFSGTSFLSGPWADYSSLAPVDIVITSETIYNPASYPSLLQAITSCLRGDCFLACKRYYFGVGGGTELFLQSASAAGIVAAVETEVADGRSSVRDIVKLSV